MIFYSLQKDVEARPKYEQILEYQFIKDGMNLQQRMYEYIKEVFEKYQNM